VFSAQVWAGIAVAGLAVVLFVVSGPLRRRGQDKRQDEKAVGTRTGAAAPGRELSTRTAPTAATAPAKTPVKAPAKARRGGPAAEDDDGLGDVEDILRRHGIT
jgi:hypothetical protein